MRKDDIESAFAYKSIINYKIFKVFLQNGSKEIFGAQNRAKAAKKSAKEAKNRQTLKIRDLYP